MWPQSEETVQLLSGAEGGDIGAVNRLMNRHRDALKRLVRMRMDKALARRVDASDVVQDVMFEASRRLNDYLREPKMPFHLWLRQLAKDRIIDMHRRHREAQRRSVDREQPLESPQFADRSSLNLAAQLRDHELTPAAENIRRELRTRFLTAMEQLSEDDRDMIFMRHFEELTNSEVATSLGLSAPAAGMRYLRALRRLKAILGESPSAMSVPRP